MTGITPVAGSPVADKTVALPSGLSADSGSFLFNGQDVTLRVGYKLPVEAASFLFTGQEVNLTISVSQESFLRVLLVGSAATIVSGIKMITNFQMVAGDSKSLVVSVKDAAGLAVNITGSTIKWRAARSFGKAAAISKSTSSGIQITDGANGQFTVTLDPADTQDLLGVYYHEAEITSATGDISTVLSGTMKISPALIAS